MSRRLRTTFTAAVVTTVTATVALAAGCGGGSKPAAVEPTAGGAAGAGGETITNPPPPDAPRAEWMVNQTGNGQCMAFDDVGGPERYVYCPEGVTGDVNARLTEVAPGQCMAVLEPCGEECAPFDSPCPDPVGSWDEDEDDDGGDE
jgi:hypothetical protein